MRSQSNVREYFRGKSVLLTGATGFFGQFIVYKLIKFCEIASILVILRPRSNETVEERLQTLLNGDLFEDIDIRALKEKVIAIKGDVTEEGFGLDADALRRIKHCVLFIHSAANIRLNATLSESLLTNTNATRNALQICGQLPKLEKFVYVSTTYVFDETVLKEKVHEFPLSAVEINQILDCLLNNNDLNATLRKKLQQKSSMNNYCLSKTLSEILVSQDESKVEKLIFRPSVVFPSRKEPFPAWFTGTQIISNFAIYISSGLWRVPNLNPEQKMAVIPVDVCGNALLKAISSQSPPSGVNQQRLTVINAVTDNISLNYICKMFKTLSKSNPMLCSIRPVISNFEPLDGQKYFEYKRFFYETLFAICVDFIYKCIGLRPIQQKTARRMQEFFDSIKQCSRLCEFKCNKLNDLWNECCNEDKQLFSFDPFDIDLEEIFDKFYLRLRMQMNGRKDVDNRVAQARQFRVNVIYYLITIIPMITLLLLVWILA